MKIEINVSRSIDEFTAVINDYMDYYNNAKINRIQQFIFFRILSILEDNYKHNRYKNDTIKK